MAPGGNDCGELEELDGPTESKLSYSQKSDSGYMVGGGIIGDSTVGFSRDEAFLRQSFPGSLIS